MSIIKPPQSYVSADRASAILKKWKPMLDFSDKDVAPVTDPARRLNTAIILENQHRWCNEAVLAQSGGVFGTHTNYNTTDARLPKIVIPMIRRTFPELMANELFGVQPMSGPVGLAYAMRYKYDGAALGATTTAGKDGSLPQGTWASPHAEVSNGKEVGHNYNDTRYTGEQTTDFEDGPSHDTNFGAHNMSMLDIDKGVGALLSSLEYSSQLPQLSMSFEKTAIEAKTRKLTSTFSTELEQDVRAMTGIDIDSELTNAMAYEVQAEIDRELVLRAIRVCVKQGGKGKGWSVWSPATSDGRWQLERIRTFYQKLVLEASRIGTRNRIGSANFLVVTPTIASLLEALPEFQWVNTQGTVDTRHVGIAKVGTLGGRFTVYRDTRTEGQFEGGLRSTRVEYALLGFKGSEYWNTGIVYCPYIPLMVQRTTGPNDFSPRIGMFTRYGIVDNLFGAENFYHTVFVPEMYNTFGNNTVFVE